MIYYRFNFIASALLLFVTPSAFSQTLTLEQVLQRVVDHYPSIRAASIQVEKAKQEGVKVDSQLGWLLGAEGGVSTNVSPFGIASDKFDAGGSLSRQLESGSTLSLDAAISHEDSDVVFSPLLPNPTTISRLDLTYRAPLLQGSDNASFAEAKVGAEAGVLITKANKEKLYDQLAENVIGLYLSLAVTQARILNNEKTIERSRRLQKFIKSRKGLGISEEKDTLQVNAQLLTQEAQLSAFNVLWQKQRIALNRLMGSAANEELTPVLNTDIKTNLSFEKIHNTAKQHSPELKSVNGRILQADSAIRLQRDTREDNFDLVLFAGARNQSGDTAAGSSNESDIVGGARLEFLQNQDKTGLDAQLYQAQLDRSSAIEDKRQILEDLYYEISSLVVEMDASNTSLIAYRKSVASETAKLKEAEERYKTGRADTDQLIQFESELSIAELSFELQQIELIRRSLELQLKQGVLWNSIHLYEMNDFLKDYEQ